MKRFTTYKCTTCARTTNKANNTNRPFIDLCTITQNCRGKLLPISLSDVVGLSQNAPPVGLTNWVARGQSNLAITSTADNVDLHTGINNQLTLAIPYSIANSVVVTFEEMNSVTTPFTKFVFKVAPGSIAISGTDNGENGGRLFQYDASDAIKVYVGGVLVSPTSYNLYTGVSSAVPKNTIIFNNALVGTTVTQVDILIMKSTTSGTTVPITFIKQHVADSINGSWDGVETVTINNVLMSLYTFKGPITGVKFGSNLRLLSISTLTSPSSAYFLLANSPYSRIDAIRCANINASALTSSPILYDEYQNATRLSVSPDTITARWPLIIINSDDIKQRPSASSGTSSSSKINSSLIIGPY